MTRFSRLQYSVAALAFLAALGTSVQAGHAGQYQVGQFQRGAMVARPTMNAQTVTTQPRMNTLFNSIRVRKDLGAGPTPDG